MIYKEIPLTKTAQSLLSPDPPMRLITPGQLIKVAETESPLHPQVQEYIRSIQPDGKSTWVLVNAMGAGEWYGDNINGDFFPYKELVTHTEKFLAIPILDYEKRRLEGGSIPGGYPTFYTAGVFKHHINKDPLKSFGDIFAAIWNESMKRVELIIRLDHARSKSLDTWHIVERIMNGEFVDVSMGCKVPYDVCSICGNKAKTKEEYCQHIRDRRKNRDPRGDGQRPYMINIQPRFFDLSFVFIGADKTARVLKKIASAQTEKLSFVSLPQEASLEQRIREKLAAIQKEGKQLKLADIIKYVVPNPEARRVSKIEGGEPDLPVSMQDELGELGMEGAMNETAHHGIVLKPHEFMRIALIGNGLKHLLDKFHHASPAPVEDVELPFGLHPQLHKLHHGDMENSLSAMSHDRGVTPPIIVKREISITMICPRGMHGSSPNVRHHPLLNKISAAYNGYRCWLLANQSELGLNKTAELPTMGTMFANRDALTQKVADVDLTTAYLLTAHWPAGERNA